MSDLSAFSAGESIASIVNKLNAIVADVNNKTTEIATLTDSLGFILPEITSKLVQKPYFFTTLQSMIECTYLQTGNSCFVIGEESVTDGKMKLFYISDDSELVADGESVVQITGVDLKAQWISDELNTELRGLISSNEDAIGELVDQIDGVGGLSDQIEDNANNLDPTKLTGAVGIDKGGTGATTTAEARTNLDLKSDIIATEVSLPVNADWASFELVGSSQLYYYDFTIAGFTANQRFMMQLDESKYTTTNTLKIAKKLAANLVSIDGGENKIRIYSNTPIEADGIALHFLLYKFF